MAAEDPASSRIFISYRREDTAGHVLALLPALREHFGADRIFKDTDNIPPGVDFVKFIKRELESCSVLLAIIGRDWLVVQDPRLKIRRLDNPDDYLRLEVATALKSERIRVIPVLVGRSVMPSAEDLPADLAELSLRNALELSDSRWDTDVRRLIDAIRRASAAAPPQAAVPQRPELQDLQERRARQIASHLQDAQEAFESHEYEAAVWACEKALLLDPNEHEALELMGLARKAIDAQKIAAWLAEAQQLLARRELGGASELIDQAQALDYTSEAALKLRQELLRLRREEQQKGEHARAARAAVQRARASLDEEDFGAALRHADEALERDPHSGEAQDIRSTAQAALDERRRQREHKRRAQQAVTEARGKFAAGQQEEALRLLREFSPAHDLVSQTLLELQKETDTRQRERQIAELMKNATGAVAAARFDDAVALLREVARIEPGRADAAALLSEAEAGLAAAAAAALARREADARVSEALAKFRDRDYRSAEQLIEAARAHDPQHPDIDPWLRRIRSALEEEAAAAQRHAVATQALTDAQASLKKGELSEAIGHAEAALAIEPMLDEARSLLEDARAALAEQRKRQEHEGLAAQTVEEARRVFDSNRQAAIDLLERFSPPHPLVSRALGELEEQVRETERQRRRQEEEAEAKRREELEQRQRQQREEEAKRREAAERAAAEKRRAQEAEATARAEAERTATERRQAEARAREEKIAAAVNAAEQSRSHDEALRHLNEGLALDPANEMLRKLVAAREAARDREEAERRQQQAMAVLVSKLEGHLAAEQLDEAERLLKEARKTLPPSPTVDLLRDRAKALRRRKDEQAREERIQHLLAEAQAAFTATEFKQATARASEVLRLAPAHEAARSLLESATRELRAASPAFWSPARLRLAAIGGAAAVLLAASVWIWSGRAPSGSQPPAEQVPATTTPTPTPQIPAGNQTPTGRGAVPSTPKEAPPPPTPASTEATTPRTDVARQQRLELLRETARRQFQSGQRAQALGTAAEGLQIDPRDSALQSVLDSLLREAQDQAQQAKADAGKLRADSLPELQPSRPGERLVPAGTAFREGVVLEEQASKLRAANRKEPAIRAFWEAETRFQVATQQAKEHGDELARRKRLDDLARQKQLDEQARLKPPAPEPPQSPLPAPPKPAEEPTRPPAVSRAEEEARVRAALQRYERAYDTLSVNEVQAVYPAVEADKVKRAFGDMRSYTLRIQIQDIELSPDAASATVRGNATHDMRPKAGSATRQTRPQTFTLQKRGSEWIIVQVR